MQSAFGVLNAEGTVVQGIKGLNRTNARLLKQNGACGEPVTLRFKQKAKNVMGSKKALRQLQNQSGGLKRAKETLPQETVITTEAGRTRSTLVGENGAGRFPVQAEREE